MPLAEINAACKADKERKSGTIRNLHKWFAPAPLPAWRALLFAALVDDPGDEEKRAYLLDLIKRLVANMADLPDADSMSEAQRILLSQFPNGLPTVFDPFCGGGSTLVEGQRLGLPTYGTDLNPVPALITRTLTELLPRVHGMQPLHARDAPRPGRKRPRGVSSARENSLFDASSGKHIYPEYEGIKADVSFYAALIRAQAWEKLQVYYPLHSDEKPIAWLWARTIKCPNPTCGIETVLTTSWWLSKKAGERAWIEPSVQDGQLVLRVISGQRAGEAPEPPKVGRGAAFVCVACPGVLDEAYVAAEGSAGRMGLRMTAVIVEKEGRRHHRAPSQDEIDAAASVPAIEDFPNIPLPNIPRWFSGPRFGLKHQADLYTRRQLLTLTTFAELVAQVHERVMKDGGSRDWADAVATLLGLALGRLAMSNSTQARVTVKSDGTTTRFNAAFGRNDVPMTWDFPELDAVGEGGTWASSLPTVLDSLVYAPSGNGQVRRADARSSSPPEPALVATDPPYFDAIGYADLSDYFYIWHRLALRDVHPDLYQTIAAPRHGELTAVAAHHSNNPAAARTYFIEGFTETFRNLQRSMAPDLPMLVVYASKEQKGGREEETRWSSILTAMVQADLEVTGTWPIHGTGSTRMIGQGTNAVATYVVMVCRPRPLTAGSCSLGEFNRSLRRELKPAVQDFQAAGILPVDLAQAAMGPGMQVYSRYRQVLDQAGKAVPVEQALRLISAALGEVLDEQEGELDPYSRFAVSWWERHGWTAAAFGEADHLARPQGISVDELKRAGVVGYPKPGFVAVLGAEPMDRTWTPNEDTRPTAWEAVHHLADRLIDGGGTRDAGRLMGELGTFRDSAQSLVYRLHAIAARKGWTRDQERYNALIGSWSDLLAISATEKDGLF
ncbi:putative DNA methylase [Saccharothrix carnea]|uniref:Putative DNA methylase n=2 Tax=Saccharothrix carnea TaxID=1280637 RepID=A0A2P8HYW9_SACCR|nr:putative DNA methylase [Saccharothrix carnea]